MSEPHDLPDAPGASPADPKAPVETSAADPKAPGPWRYRWIAIGLAGALLLVLGWVASAPFWAPLLPWAPAPVPASRETPVARVDRAALPQPENQAQAGWQSRSPPSPGEPPQSPSARSQPQSESQPPQSPPAPSQPDETAASPALQLLDRRVGALEARPAAPASDIAEIRQQLTGLASSVGALEARPAAPASDIAEIRQQLTGLASTVADLDARVAAIGKPAPAQAAADATDMALVLALLQIRGALEVGRPFAAEYEALVALARARPEIAVAAAPLADPAKTGLATRAVLASRLRELAGVIAAARTAGDADRKAPAGAGETAPDWTDRALTRLRGLVTIRRTDASAERPPGGRPKVPVSAAELALAGGDLEAAVGALDRLTGAPAEAAGPWLRMAKERLAVEAALHRIDALLVARLGSTSSVPSSAPGGGGSPR